jgi:hypothetical protein
MHEAHPVGCIISPTLCKSCADIPEIQAILSKYAPKLNRPRKKRDAEIASVGARLKEQEVSQHNPKGVKR